MDDRVGKFGRSGRCMVLAAGAERGPFRGEEDI